MNDKIVYGLITGGFDPLHVGHMDYIEESAKRCNHLYIGLNSDKWLTRKKGANFMKFEDRKRILSGIKNVKDVFSFNDDDDTACEAINILLQLAQSLHPDDFIIRFMNGGDRVSVNTPEQSRFTSNKKVQFLYCVGGGKRDSSSELIKKAVEHKLSSNRVDRNWGYYEVLSENKSGIYDVKVKKLVVNSGAALSMQYHLHRGEIWFVAEGKCKIEREAGNIKDLNQGEMTKIIAQDWHRLINPTDQPVVVYEIQYGRKCEEEDIVRA